MQVGAVAEALPAAAAGVDAVIAPGIQAGGHNKSTAPTFPLVSDIVAAVAPLPVLAAGGIATGHDDEWAGREAEIPNPSPPPDVIGNTILFPGSLRAPYAMPKFSAILPTPDTTGDFDEMCLPAGAESVKRIRAVKPAGEIVAEMMGEAAAIG